MVSILSETVLGRAYAMSPQGQQRRQGHFDTVQQNIPYFRILEVSREEGEKKKRESEKLSMLFKFKCSKSTGDT